MTLFGVGNLFSHRVIDDPIATLWHYLAPGFICFAAGEARDSSRFVTRIHHIFGRPASDATIADFLKTSGKKQWNYRRPDQICDFFESHNGLLLHAPMIPRFGLPASAGDGGIRIFPMEEWIEIGVERVHKQFDGMGVIDPVVGRDDCIAIGEVPLSANLFAMVVRGPRAGEIVRLDHDRSVDASSSLGRIFDEFLANLCREPARLLHDLGCYTRYADGVTDKQWIPFKYVEDTRSLTEPEIRSAKVPFD